MKYAMVLFGFLFIGTAAAQLVGEQLTNSQQFRVKTPRMLPIEHMQIPSGWNYSTLGAFCKLDVQLERRLGLPVLIRLGDVHLVERMEDKGVLRNPPRD